MVGDIERGGEREGGGEEREERENDDEGRHGGMDLGFWGFGGLFQLFGHKCE